MKRYLMSAVPYAEQWGNFETYLMLNKKDKTETLSEDK